MMDALNSYCVLKPVKQNWPGIATVILAIFLGAALILLPLRSAVLLIAGSVVFLLTVIQPFWGLALALLAGPFGALEQVISGRSGLDTGQLLLFFTLAAWIGRSMARRKINLPTTFLTLPFLLLLGVGLLSLLDAPSVELGLRELLKWVEMWLIVLLVVDLGTEAPRRKRPGLFSGSSKAAWIVAMLLLAGLSQAVIGIWQFGFRGDGPEHFIVLDHFYRAYGTFEQPNPFGGYMNLSALLAIGILVGLLGVWWKVGSGEWRVASGENDYRSLDTAHLQMPKLVLVTGLVLVVAGLTILALLFSWSRGAWLGFAAGLAVMVFLWPRKRIYGLLMFGTGFFLVISLAVTGHLPGSVTSRLTGFVEDFRFGDVRGLDINDDNYSVLERQAHWQAGLDMLRDDIYLGVGFGNYQAAYPEYALINWPDPLGHAHNYYINLLAEVGVLGLLAYLIFWTVVFWQSIRMLRHLDWPDRGIVLGLCGVWTALAAHHLVDKLYVNNIYIHLGVLLGLLQLMGFEYWENGNKLRNSAKIADG